MGRLLARINEILRLDIDENTVTCDFYHLDYCNSSYHVFRDEKMLRILREYGLVE